LYDNAPVLAGLTASRVEAFSDGVLAIAATLLVLELRVPDPGQDLAQALLAQAPSYATYLVSFLTIGIIWVNHHQLFAHVRRVDRTLLFLNLLRLLVVSLTPFPTALLGRFVTAERDSHVGNIREPPPLRRPPSNKYRMPARCEAM